MGNNCIKCGVYVPDAYEEEDALCDECYKLYGPKIDNKEFEPLPERL